MVLSLFFFWETLRTFESVSSANENIPQRRKAKKISVANVMIKYLGALHDKRPDIELITKFIITIIIYI